MSLYHTSEKLQIQGWTRPIEEAFITNNSLTPKESYKKEVVEDSKSGAVGDSICGYDSLRQN